MAMRSPRFDVDLRVTGGKFGGPFNLGHNYSFYCEEQFVAEKQVRYMGILSGKGYVCVGLSASAAAPRRFHTRVASYLLRLSSSCFFSSSSFSSSSSSDTPPPPPPSSSLDPLPTPTPPPCLPLAALPYALAARAGGA